MQRRRETLEDVFFAAGDGVNRAMSDARIIDSGYRRYDGARLGESHATFALWKHTLRRILGLGRPARWKLLPLLTIAHRVRAQHRLRGRHRAHSRRPAAQHGAAGLRVHLRLHHCGDRAVRHFRRARSVVPRSAQRHPEPLPGHATDADALHRGQSARPCSPRCCSSPSGRRCCTSSASRHKTPGPTASAGS